MVALLINLAHKAVAMRLWNKDGGPGFTDWTRAAASAYFARTESLPCGRDC